MTTENRIRKQAKRKAVFKLKKRKPTRKATKRKYRDEKKERKKKSSTPMNVNACTCDSMKTLDYFWEGDDDDNDNNKKASVCVEFT